MKAILNGKLYDTNKSVNLCNFFGHSVYKTNNGTLFMTYNDGGALGEQISNVNYDEIKETIGRYCPDSYILIFGKVEEA